MRFLEKVQKKNLGMFLVYFGVRTHYMTACVVFNDSVTVIHAAYDSDTYTVAIVLYAQDCAPEDGILNVHAL